MEKNELRLSFPKMDFGLDLSQIKILKTSLKSYERPIAQPTPPLYFSVFDLIVGICAHCITV